MNLVKFSVPEWKLLWVGHETFCHKHIYWMFLLLLTAVSWETVEPLEDWVYLEKAEYEEQDFKCLSYSLPLVLFSDLLSGEHC